MRVNFWLSGMQQNHFWILSNFHICERETWDECLVVKSDVIANDLGQRWLPSPLGNHIICLAARWHLQGDKFLSSAIWSVVLWRIIFDTVEWCTSYYNMIYITRLVQICRNTYLDQLQVNWSQAHHDIADVCAYQPHFKLISIKQVSFKKLQQNNLSVLVSKFDIVSQFLFWKSKFPVDKKIALQNYKVWSGVLHFLADLMLI